MSCKITYKQKLVHSRTTPETLDEKDCEAGSDDEVGFSGSQQRKAGTTTQGFRRIAVEECDPEDSRPDVPQDADDIIEDFYDD